jgi:Domain of unknown function (DUF4349)
MNRRLIGVALGLGVVAVLATACTSAGDSAQSTSGGGSVQVEDSGGAGESTQEGQDGKAGKRDISQPGVDRSLVRTANIAMTAEDVGEVVDRARDVAAAEGGYAGREEVREETASLTLHIPSDRFDHALAELSELGEVSSREQSAQDVTEQVVDLDSRIATQRARVERVRALLARANTVEEIVRIEQEVTTRESELESLEQRRQVLGDQVAMSTVTIGVSKTDAPAPPPQEEESSGFLAGLTAGWGAFLDTGTVALRVVGALLPFLFVLAIPAVPLVLRWRRRRTAASAVVQQS